MNQHFLTWKDVVEIATLVCNLLETIQMVFHWLWMIRLQHIIYSMYRWDICIDEIYVSVPCINVCIYIYTCMTDSTLIYQKLMMLRISNSHTLFCHHIYLDKCSYPLSHQTLIPKATQDGGTGVIMPWAKVKAQKRGFQRIEVGISSSNLQVQFTKKNLRIFSVENYTSMPEFHLCRKNASIPPPIC